MAARRSPARRRAATRPAALVLVLGAIACGRGGGPGAPDTLDAVRARGELVWAADIQGGEPYVFEDPADPTRLVGFEVEIADGIARRLGVTARFVQFTWSNLVPSLERGDFDIALNGLEATPDRQERILLSRPYFIYAETLAVRTGVPESSLAALRGKRVATLNQTYAYDILQASAVETVLYEGVEEPYLDLVAGRVDGVLLDNVIADRYGCGKEGVTCLPGDVARGAYVIGMRKADRRLKEAIDGALEQMATDGELRAILERWRLWDERQTEPLPATVAAAGARRLGGAQVLLFVQGAAVTAGLSVASFALAVPLGLLLAVVRLHAGALPRALSVAYVELFRGTPVLLQLYVLYYGLAPVLRLGPVEAAILGLGLNYAAYESEVYRGAILAIPRGQSEAACALGFGTLQSLRHVILPQSLRVALPAMTNDFVALLKDSSLVSVITVVELTKRMTIAAVDVRGWLLPGVLCAALYLAMSLPLARLSARLERRLNRDPHPGPR